MRRATRLYRALLFLFPGDFRRTFGGDMAQLFADRLAETTGHPRGRAALWVRALLDLCGNAAREWVAVAAQTWRDFFGEGMGMDVWFQDVRYAVRSLTRRPAFTIAATLTLALGIGANVSIFSVVNGVLLNPLPYPDSEDLYVVWTESPETGFRGRSFDHPDIRAIQSAVPDLSISGFAGTRPTLLGFGDPEVLTGTRTTDGLIDLMGRTPVMGRDLVAADDDPSAPRVVVISHSFWVDRLARDPNVLGRTLSFSGVLWEIVGVAPEGFDYPDRSEVWFPRRHDASSCGHGCRTINAIARIQPGSSQEEVAARLHAVGASLADEFPKAHEDQTFTLESMLEYEVADVRTALLVLLGAVGMVLLIACANVANLMIVRANARGGEVALRATLGATRMRLARQLLTESAVLATAAGVVGLVIANWGTMALVAKAPDTLPRFGEVGIDGSVLAFAALLVIAVTGVFGALPSFQVSRTPLQRSLSGGRRSIGRRSQTWSRSALLVGEIALSLTLLLGAGLLVRTLGEVRAVDLGFETESIERFRISVPGSRYDSLGVVAFLEELETSLTAIPGVRSAGWGFGVPLASGSINTTIRFLDRPEVPVSDLISIDIRPATVGYLDAAGLTLQRGRWFEASDRYGAPRTAVINESLANSQYPDRDPIGLTLAASISWGFEESGPMTIVGIVKDVIKASPMAPPEPAIYMPNAQFAANTGYVSLRLEPGIPTAIPEARAVIGRMDPSLAIWDVTTMDEVVRGAHATTTFYLTLLSAFSILALVLAAVGLYGVVAYMVGQRTREIGIRIALGAATDEVVSMILRQGMRPALLGIVVGLGTSWFAAKALASMLFGVSPQDPLTMITVTLILLVVVVAATVLPARHASRVPPASALRAE